MVSGAFFHKLEGLQRSRGSLNIEVVDLEADNQSLQEAGVTFEELLRNEPYGKVVVWCAPWGNRWGLIEFNRPDKSGTAS